VPVNARPLIVILLALLLVPQLGGEPATVRLLLVFPGQPLGPLLGDSHLALDDPKAERWSKALVDDALIRLAALRRLGIPLRVVEVLTHVVYGAIVEVPRGAVGALEDSPLVEAVYRDHVLTPQLARSVRLIGAPRAWSLHGPAGFNLTGVNITVAIIDTGVDYTHPDLGGGFGPGYKVVGGYDFADTDTDPRDEDGHGTHVAGIVGAKGGLTGVAPDVRILAYRVGGTSTLLSLDVVRALDRAVREGADVVNLSLGAEMGERAVRLAARGVVESGVVLVAAAGNFGPANNTIATPASDPYILTVGATGNNVSMSLAAYLELDPPLLEPEVYPMNGSPQVPEGVSGELVYVRYARATDVDGLDLRGKIALAERGGELGELVYFSEKEANVARRGALALIIFNNMAGPFVGTLIHPFNPPGYKPRIPVVSLSREAGLVLKEAAERGHVRATLIVRVEPDVIALFSSRGPASPFNIKPDLVAPGAFINSTDLKGTYSVMSGTSFAAPHVAGAAALLLQLHPDLTPGEVAGILVSTAKPLVRPDGREQSYFAQGGGRLDLARAVRAPLAPKPHQLVFHLSPGQTQASQLVTLKSLTENPLPVAIGFSGLPEDHLKIDASPDSRVIGPHETVDVVVKAQLLGEGYGSYQGRMVIATPQMNLTLPVLVTVNHIPVKVEATPGGLVVSFKPPDSWSDGYVRVIDPEGDEEFQLVYSPTNTTVIEADVAGRYEVEVVLRTREEVLYGRVLYTLSEPIPAPEIGLLSRLLQLLGGLTPYVAGVAIVALLLFIRARRKRREQEFLEEWATG
jgi:minor extracellular serine protease Vpr